MVSWEIDKFCQAHPINKHRLLQQHRTGYYIALLSAIRYHPESGDDELIMQIRKDKLPSGFAYYKLMDAVEDLKTSNEISSSQLRELQIWLRKLDRADERITTRIESLSPEA